MAGARRVWPPSVRLENQRPVGVGLGLLRILALPGHGAGVLTVGPPQEVARVVQHPRGPLVYEPSAALWLSSCRVTPC